jgi:hypothetical protein
MVQQLVPASAQLPGVTNVVEGHLLDRGGKYQTKFPTLENKQPIIQDPIRGINEMLYDWTQVVSQELQPRQLMTAVSFS